MSTRLSVNVNDETALVLRYFAMQHGTTVTEEVRRAVSVLHYLENAQAERKRIRTVDRDGAIQWVTLL